MRLFKISVAVATLAAASAAAAQTRSQVWGGPLTKEAQTLYLSAETGPTTFESEAAGSKETQMTTSYAMGAWAGEGRQVGAEVRTSDAEVPFSLNDASMKTSFRDVRFMVRLGWFTPFATAGLSEVDVKAADTSTVSLYGTGIGGGLAIGVPLHEMLVVQAEGSTTQSAKAYDKLNQTAELGRRDEADAHLSFDVTDRMVDLLVGYKVRRYELDTGEQKFNEQSQGAYAGLRLGLYF
jgi:hypothetical protein